MQAPGRFAVVTDSTTTGSDRPPFRYNAALANEIERKWQHRWEVEHTFWAPNPVGPLSAGFERMAGKPKLFVLDMFPYPSGTGLHVGHPLGFIGTDVYARYQRMNGRNVLHAMGYDAFGLPAEQYAVQTGQHPRVTTEANIANMRRQMRALGLAHDPRRGPSTTDVDYYRWTQWIFLQIFNSWYDERLDRARPIAELEGELASGTRPVPDGRLWAELEPVERRALVDDYRLAYIAEAPVNWCPALGTVLANEEVTADGRSERGNHPVFRRPLKQWMMRITAYNERLLADLDGLDWTYSIKLMQRNWIGKSRGAEVVFTVEGPPEFREIRVFTTRPDTLFGATYMVLAPEHPLVDDITPSQWPGGPEFPEGTPNEWIAPWGTESSPVEAVHRYRQFAASKSDLERQLDDREKTGVFTGAFARNPVNGEQIPVFIADYVLMGYGTGAIMAVPAHDQRDFEFATEFELPMRAVVQPSAEWLAAQGDSGADALDPSRWTGAYTGDGPLVNSSSELASIDGLTVAEAIAAITGWLEEQGLGFPTVTYKLRDWLFSRQRYWGEPFPIVYDEDGAPRAVPESMLPVELPEITDYTPRILADDDQSVPEPPLGRAEEWAEVELDLEDGRGLRHYTRELNTMPQWAGSCWYYLRYLDPTNQEAFVDPEVEHYWSGGTRGNGEQSSGCVDLYVGGVEHAVLHLLYARFWHTVLFDLGHVSTPETFQRLYNPGYIQAYAYTDARGIFVDAAAVEARDGGYFYEGEPVDRQYGKMGKSLKNSVAPDEIYDDYGADTLRLYEMFMGPLDASRPWSTADIVGVHRFLQRLWRNAVDEETGELRVTTEVPDPETRKLLHRTIDSVGRDLAALQNNTAIARLFELNNRLTTVVQEQGEAPEEVVQAMALMLAPLAPHVAEELWERLGHGESLAFEPFPLAEPGLLVDDEVQLAVQINGKVRARVNLPSGLDTEATEAAVRADAAVAPLIEGAIVRKVVVVPGRLVNFVLG